MRDEEHNYNTDGVTPRRSNVAIAVAPSVVPLDRKNRSPPALSSSQELP
jgi:hypothetical protein